MIYAPSVDRSRGRLGPSLVSPRRAPPRVVVPQSSPAPSPAARFARPCCRSRRARSRLPARPAAVSRWWTWPPSPSRRPVPRVVEGKLVDGLGAPLTLRGIAFTNRVWQDDPLPDEHHARSTSRVGRRARAELRVASTSTSGRWWTGLRPGEYRDRGFRVARSERRLGEGARDLSRPWPLRAAARVPSDRRRGALWFDGEAQRRFVELWRGDRGAGTGASLPSRATTAQRARGPGRSGGVAGAGRARHRRESAPSIPGTPSSSSAWPPWG
jgi:hypothetical protein